MLPQQSVNPARSYEQALERVRAFQALDDESILPQARTALLAHGARTKIAAVLLHGLTNHPGQYEAFAPLLFERGVNVFVPRLPEQGDRNRMTTRLAALTAEALLGSASEAVDIACGLGERVCVLGISTSGLLAAYFAQYRDDVSRAIAVAPVFAMLDLPYGVSRAIAAAARFLPNAFLWWDPSKRAAQMPPTAYPRFPTHALAQCLRIGDDVIAASGREPFRGRSAVLVTNAKDPAVNNRVTGRVGSAWRARRPDAVESFCFTDLPRNHDIIDPQNPVPRTDIVYPQLSGFVLSSP